MALLKMCIIYQFKGPLNILSLTRPGDHLDMNSSVEVLPVSV